MRKFTLLCIVMLAFAGFANAQTIEDFESIKMNGFDVGANGSVTVVANPDPTGINTSLTVGKMVRGADGQPWAGWYATIPTPVDVTANKYVHIKVWKPRISPVVFKYEGGGGNSGDVYSMNPQTLVNQWEELVFDMSVVSGEYVKIVLIPDFESPLTLTEDITLYFDDLYVNNDPSVGSAPAQVMENYEYIPLGIMTGGAEDLSYFQLIPNPDKSGVNLSDYVIKFHRDKDGVPWGGWYSGTQVDVTTNKYMHVKVWKPRISPIKFKIEAGAAGTLEVAATNAQTVVNGWADYVFDFSEKTGTYPTIVFLPDFEDPLTLTEDIDLYFDDVILNNDPNPITPPVQVINVDMSESGLAEGQQVFLSGALGGVYGTWNEPGTNANNEMFDLDGDKIYSISLALPDGVIAFKFFMGTGWGSGDPAPGGDRTYTVAGSCNITYKWGVDGLLGVPVNPLAGKVQMYPNPVSNKLQINTTAKVDRVIITSTLGQVVENIEMTSDNLSISTASLSNGMYFVTFVGNDGSKLTQKLMKN
ncbi:MAG: T9SS type A sorting domain-containing protein [Bacteroidales bacterium]|nr:T9SS type A sorting domain-containing protein [Bacteroidales bacterium]